MSTLALNPSTPAAPAAHGSYPGANVAQDVVEIGLLLPANWAAALIDLSEKRQQSVGQLLRSLISRALEENNSTF
jgi:hypothetical protein